MKLTITHLKAPWPAGAVVGSVIELASVPAWALGKCAPADDGAAVTVGQVEQEQPVEPNMDDLRAQAAALGIKVDGRWSFDRLSSEIEKAKSE